MSNINNLTEIGVVDRTEVDLRTDESCVGALERTLIHRGVTPVEVGCPIDDQIAVRVGSDVTIFRATTPGVLANALGARQGLVRDTVAWAPHATGFDPERGRLVVAVADLHGVNVRERPVSVEVVTVEIAGWLTRFVPDLAGGPVQWVQLREFLTIKVAHAAHRGQSCHVGPMTWGHPDPPAVIVSAEPGDDMSLGFGFHVQAWPFPDLGEEADVEEPAPIAPYRRSALPAVADAMCDVIKTWDVSPFNVGYLTSPHRRGPFIIPH